MDTLLPRLAVPEAPPGTLTREALFPDARELWLEIGFGGGEHLVAQAIQHSDVGFVGCEPFVEGMAKALTGIEAAALANVRLHLGDAREIMARLATASVERVFILFPDPWPKKRHWKRRLVNADFLDDLAHILAPGARVRFATDVTSYANEALLAFLQDGRFAWTAETAGDWREPPRDHVTTRYEAKRLGDCAPVYFDFRFENG